MSVTGFYLIIATAFFTLCANLLMRIGIDRGGGFHPTSMQAVFMDFVNLLFQPLFAIGFVTYFAAALVWFRVVASEPLSIAYPILVSSTFILVSCAASLLFGEPFTLRKALGLILIIGGIIAVSSAPANH
ncbi:DMT family transporter [Azospirillum canadense]|uniref:hypothetical protein n=1 Tax=Azospirillum canadense TaxID=403962 RepID=UPI002226B3F4|nr:hypothetical protein [Azospirillum canadense]MCW2240921.1 multidrug transporter EmrE-like cation transporter [Azospirillum canadense]